MKTILILAYYSVDDPVFKSAVLPYFVNFPDKDIRFIMCTYENDRFPLTNEKREYIESIFNENNIIWYDFKWRSGRFKIFKKLIDLIKSFWNTRFIIKQNQVSAVYSEGFPGAIIGYFISRLNRVKHYIHTFEPHADYMLEAGVWQRSSWEYLLLRKFERVIAKHASFIFTATEGMKERIKTWGVSQESIHLVPSAIDLNKFYYDTNGRNEIRRKLAIKNDKCLVVYLGKIGGMYMKEEIFQFYRSLLKNSKLDYSFLFLTNEPQELINGLIKKYNIPENNVKCKYVESNQVYKYLSASDIGFVAVRQKESKKYCSPIKTGEYLACGLPVIIPEGISDDFHIIRDKGIGVNLKNMEENSFKLATKHLEHLMENNEKEALIKKCRNYALVNRDIVKYKKLYASIF